jgi:hypothetical protein
VVGVTALVGWRSSAFLTLEQISAIYSYWRFAQLRRAKRLNVPLAEVAAMR